MLNWDDMRYLVALDREGSLAAAARALAVDETTVARRLRALESGLGARLFERVDRRWLRTAAGEAALAQGRRMEEEMLLLAARVEESSAQVQGAVRITAIDALVTGYLGPRVAALLGRYPNLSVHMIGGNGNLSLTRREADLAIRMARPTRGALVIRKLVDCGYAVYAARGSSAPGIETLREGRRWVGYDENLWHVPEMQWLRGVTDLHCLSLRSNGVHALVEAVAAGAGLGVLPCFLADHRPELCRVSGPMPVVSRELWLLVLEDRRDSPAIRAVAEWLVGSLAADAELLSGRSPLDAAPLAP